MWLYLLLRGLLLLQQELGGDLGDTRAQGLGACGERAGASVDMAGGQRGVRLARGSSELESVCVHGQTPSSSLCLGARQLGEGMKSKRISLK